METSLFHAWDNPVFKVSSLLEYFSTYMTWYRTAYTAITLGNEIKLLGWKTSPSTIWLLQCQSRTFAGLSDNHFYAYWYLEQRCSSSCFPSGHTSALSWLNEERTPWELLPPPHAHWPHQCDKALAFTLVIPTSLHVDITCLTSAVWLWAQHCPYALIPCFL